MIDGKVAWIGGAGVEDHFENGGFHDVMSRVTGNVVLQAQSVFLMTFHAHDGPLPTDLSKFFPTQPDPGTTPIVILQTVPGGWMSSKIRGKKFLPSGQGSIVAAVDQAKGTPTSSGFLEWPTNRCVAT